MITRLRLEQFKSFASAEMRLGPLTVIAGTNASGKSNLRDAFRFLHGIGRGYSLADTFGAKYGPGGDLLWTGIRGGLREVAQSGGPEFRLSITVDGTVDRAEVEVTFQLGVDVLSSPGGPQVIHESLSTASGGLLYESFTTGEPSARKGSHWLEYLVVHPEHRPVVTSNARPLLSGLGEDAGPGFEALVPYAELVLTSLRSMRFLDLSPEAMRQPSFPGQTVLGDRGENLSSVLQAICADPMRKESLLEYLGALTPMDLVDLDFVSDPAGRVLLLLVEADGRKTTAYSASDGTLRFLAMLAALLGTEPARFYFLEELENGLHPTRLSLLVDLIERRTAEGSVQVVATTHSPHLLGLLGEESLEFAHESFRREGEAETGLRRIVDLPDARRLIRSQGLPRLHASGWLEDAVAFSSGDAGA